MYLWVDAFLILSILFLIPTAIIQTINNQKVLKIFAVNLLFRKDTGVVCVCVWVCKSEKYFLCLPHWSSFLKVGKNSVMQKWKLTHGICLRKPYLTLSYLPHYWGQICWICTLSGLLSVEILFQSSMTLFWYPHILLLIPHRVSTNGH